MTNSFRTSCIRCKRHPYQTVVGVCAACLRERLLAIVEEEESDGAFNSDSSDFSPLGVRSAQRTPSRMAMHGRRLSNASVDYSKGEAVRYPQHGCLASSPLHCQRPVGVVSPSIASHNRVKFLASNTADMDSRALQEAVHRKKRASLWSMIHKRSEEGSDLKLTHRRSLGSPGAAYSSMREVHESICRGDASSLLSSPHFAPGRSKQEFQGCSKNEKRTNQQPVNLSRHYECAVDQNASRSDAGSWISSLFPRRKRRSQSVSVASISSPEIVGLYEATRRYSVDAGPQNWNQGARRVMKSGGASEDEMYMSPRKSAMATQEQSPEWRNCDQGSAATAYMSDSNVMRRRAQARFTEFLNRKERSRGKVQEQEELARSMKVSLAPAYDSEALKVRYGGRSKELRYEFGRSATISAGEEESEDEKRLNSSSRSRITKWSKAWSNTLSPILSGRKPKKSMKSRQASTANHRQIVHRHHHNHANPSHGCSEFVSRLSFPTSDHALDKRPPQHYSFLSKDYSAFSFYFSPLRRSKRRASMVDAPVVLPPPMPAENLRCVDTMSPRSFHSSSFSRWRSRRDRI